MSSSTTNTITVARFISPRQANSTFYSVHTEGPIKRLEKSGFTDGLEKAVYRALFEHARSDGLIFICGNKNYRNLLPPEDQLSLEVGTGHAGQGDIENKAFSCADAIGREELFSR